MESLHEQLGSPTLTVLLADNRGLILSLVGAAASQPSGSGQLEPGRAAASSQSLPSFPVIDAAKVGEILALPGPVQQSLRLPGRTVLGVAAPIMAPDGGVLGLLDFAASPQAHSFSHANALLQTTAAIIEHRLIETDEQGYLVLHFHTNAGMLGSPLEALAVFDCDSRLLASNRVASSLLALESTTRPVRSPDCFRTHWAGLVDQASAHRTEPFMLRAHRGRAFFARASLR